MFEPIFEQHEDQFKVELRGAKQTDLVYEDSFVAHVIIIDV